MAWSKARNLHSVIKRPLASKKGIGRTTRAQLYKRKDAPRYNNNGKRILCFSGRQCMPFPTANWSKHFTALDGGIHIAVPVIQP